MKALSRIIIVSVIYLIYPHNNLLLAQEHEWPQNGDGIHWTETRDEHSTYWYGWTNAEGEWEWSTDRPTVWPPLIDGDLDDHRDLEGDENEWMDDWDDNHVSGDQDDWWEWWDDFWDLNGDNIDIDHDPSNGNQHACPELLVLAIHPNGAGDRKRTTVGIGEIFRVYVKNICGGEPNWDVVNSGSEGFLNGGASDFAEFQANFKPGTMTIKVSIEGMQVDCASCESELEINVTVIEPNEVRFRMQSECLGRHDWKRPSAGFFTFYYLYPETVNFYNVSFKETNPVGHNVCSGDYWDGLSCPKHIVTPFAIGCGTKVYPGLGTASEVPDEAYFPLFCHKDTDNPTGVDAGLAGVLDWTIEYVYLRPVSSGSTEVSFATIHQLGRNLGNAPGYTFQFIKGNENIAKTLYQKSICPSRAPCH